MNFYEFYRLLQENTIAQELKKTQKEYSKKFVDNIINRAISNINSLNQNFNLNSKTIIAKWIAYNAIKKKDLEFSDVYPNTRDFADDISKTRISNLINMGAYFLNSVMDFLISRVDQNGNLDPQLVSKFNNPYFSPQNLNDLNIQYHENLKKKQKIGQGRPGKVILTFPDGYSWVDLERGYCDIEKETMGHCGNVAAKPGDTILSLRDAQNRPHLTFILNKGVLGEMKGRANDKPTPKYHPYIIGLLKLPIIKKVRGGGYRPKNNFKLNDLSDDQRKDLFKIKPALETEYYKEQIIDKKKVPKEFLIKITSEKFDYEFFPILAKDVNTPPEVLINLSKYDDFPLLILIAKNENSPKEAISNIEKTAVESPGTHWLINDEQDTEFWLMYELAKNINTSPEFLRNLSYINSLMIKSAVVSNGNTPIEVLEKMSREEKGDVKYLADLYLSFHKDINDKNPNVRAKVARTGYSSPVFLEKLIKDVSPIVRAAVASNPKTPTKILGKLSEDEDLSVRIALANTKGNISNDVLEKLSNDKNWEVRLALVSRSWVPDIILDKLLNDENKDVREMARMNKEKI